MMRFVNYMRLEFDARPENESFARVAVSAFTVPFNPTMDVLSDLRTAVSEAVTNCIVHGYGDTLGTIFITGRLYEGGKLVLSIRDKGKGIENVEQAMEPLFTTGNAEERSGMGFTIMETFMDKVRVTSKPGMGTTVTFTKYIQAKT